MTIDLINHIVFMMVKIACLGIPLIFLVERGCDLSAANCCRLLTFGFFCLLIIPGASLYLPLIPIAIGHQAVELAVTFPWQTQDFTDSLMFWLLATYSLGVLRGWSLWLLGQGQLARLGKGEPHAVSPHARAILSKIVAEFGIRRRVECVVNRSLKVPITWGVRRPVIALPGDYRKWSGARLTRVFLHETAHIKRFDFVVKNALGLVAPLFWCLPGHKKLLGKIQWYRELACDDMVIACGVDKTEYARDLLDFSKRGGNALGNAISLVELTDHYRRILVILSGVRSMDPVSGDWRFAASILVVAFLALGAVTIKPAHPAPTPHYLLPFAVTAEQPPASPAGKIEQHALVRPVKPQPHQVAPKAPRVQLQIDDSPSVAFKHSDFLPTNFKHSQAPTSPPVLIHYQAPVYPRRALARGYQGVVEVTFDVGIDGRVSNLRLSTPHEQDLLNQAVLAVVEKFVFQPAYRGLAPVTTRGAKEVFTFQIEDAN